jgi:very-short-patch-repair endonuclease
LQEIYIIPDFYIAKKKLIIEIDWSIHKLSEVLNLDKIKDELIEQKWFDILRITNEEIYSDLKNVINTIKHKLKE